MELHLLSSIWMKNLSSIEKMIQAKKRIAIFLPTLGGGGAERAMLTLANALAEGEEIIDLVLGIAKGEYLMEISPKVNVVDLESPRLLRSLPALVRYFRKHQPTAVLSVLNYANVLAVVARWISRASFTLILSERNNVTVPEGTAFTLKNRVLLFLMRLTYPRADGVVAVSRGVADDLSERINLKQSKISVVYNPVVTSGLLKRADEEFSHPWLSDGEPPVILGVGRLTPQKDFPTLVKAFATVRKKIPCRLVLLGEGELRSSLESLVLELGLSNDVLLPGFASNPFVWMKKSSVFVLSSKWEGLPNVLIQAMACGAQVVSTNCRSGPAEILENGKWGSLVPLESPDEMAREIFNSLQGENKKNSKLRASFFNEANAIAGYKAVLLQAKN